MSSSNTTTRAEINAFIYANDVFSRFWSYSLICLGTTGHALNIYVFTRSILRSNPCTRYFLAATISGIFCTYINVLLRLIQNLYPDYNPFGYSTASCKILSYIVYCSRCVTSWFIVLASIDRYLCSSSSAIVRGLSSIRMTSRAILFVILAVALCYLYVPIRFENIQTNVKCPGTQTTYPLFNGIWNLLIFSLGPPIMMLIFGSITIHHIQQSVRRSGEKNIRPQTLYESIALVPDRSTRQKAIDQQLIRMMLVQCLYFSLLSTPVSMLYMYLAVRNSAEFDALQAARENLFINICGLLSITGACTSFYIFTLSSPLFRRELLYLLKYQRQQNHNMSTKHRTRSE